MKVKFGKYQGQDIKTVPHKYASWLRVQGNKKFWVQWLENSRFNQINEVSSRSSHRSPDNKWLERKLSDGTFIFYITKYLGRNQQTRLYWLSDSDGNYMRDLTTFGSFDCKQGALDTTCEDWVTLTPMGRTIKGKMLVSPYWTNGFNYDTYQQKQEIRDFAGIPTYTA